MPGMFRRKRTIRRHGKPTEVQGYPTYPFEDATVLLNVQPLRADEVTALPEGKRSTKHLKAYGDDQLTPASQSRETPGDWLFYSGDWYECVSCIRYDNTPLGHYKSEFEMVSEAEYKGNLSPPEVAQ